MANSRKSGSPRRGFTLVELLVVIGIIALLISILMPGLNKARRQAVRTQCLSNLRQILTASFNYATDNKGWFPARPAMPGTKTDPTPHAMQTSATQVNPDGSLFWDLNVSFIKPYLKIRDKVMFCPAQLAARGPTDAAYVSANVTYAYYNWNPTLSFKWRGEQTNPSTYKRPDLSKLGKRAPAYALWGCLTLDTHALSSGKWAHEGYTRSDKWKEMNAVYINGSGSWVTGDDVETFFQQSSGNEYFWPRPAVATATATK